jgi:hypothetical protein
MITINMTDDEAHAVTRALSRANADRNENDPDDRRDEQRCTWVAKRILLALKSTDRFAGINHEDRG